MAVIKQKNKVETIPLSGKEYAQVKSRIKAFRELCPNGLIETTPTIAGTSVIFRARILSNKADPNSPEATGHSFAEGSKLEKEKQFEKLESIAVGRALAFLGYGGDGEIASSEEMEQFMEHQENQKVEAMEAATDRINSATSIEELKEIWTDFNGETKIAMKGILDTKKIALNEKSKVATKKPRVVRVQKGQDIGVPAEGHNSEAGNGA